MGHLESVEKLKSYDPNQQTGLNQFSLKTSMLFDFTNSIQLYRKLDYDKYYELEFPSEG